ncbi:MAG: AAA family ATPase, partial [Pseudomonadota bacterium]|nr:AAA family ATPase [Pseudomonadota bacterium]
MLRLLSIRNFAVVDALEIEFEPGFTVLTGETGAGKSILLDALSLLLGGRFETRQLRPGSERAEIAAEFDVAGAPELRNWLNEQDLGDDGPLLLRRTLDAQGRSRAWINGRPATLAQLGDAGANLVDLHGQHAYESVGRPETQ